MRNIGRQRRLRGRAAVGLAAMVALAVGGSLAATQANAASSASASSSNRHCNSSPTITVAPFGSPVPDTPYSNTPEQTFRYTLTNCQGMQIQLLTYGATTQSITVPDRRGHLKNIALGCATLADYVNLVSPPPTSPNFGGPYFGETIGRYGNRIAKGAFPLNGTTYTLPINNRYWLTYKAHNDDSKLSTVLNLTNHTYFNLAGEASGSALRQDVQINANAFTPTDANLIPTGQIAPVGGTPFDFRHLKPIFPSISDCTAGPNSLSCQQLVAAHGFDHNWVLNSTGPHFAGLNLAARALDR